MWCLETIKNLNEAACQRHAKGENISLSFSDVGINNSKPSKKIIPKVKSSLCCVKQMDFDFYKND